jgi:hypothetical protein
MTTKCTRCDGSGLVCETHIARPWEVQRLWLRRRSTVGRCNASDDGACPRMPDGFKTEVDKDGWRH